MAHTKEHDKVAADRRVMQRQACGGRLSLHDGRLVCHCFFTEYIWMLK